MGKIHVPRFTAGQRITQCGRPATVLRNGREEGSVIFVFDDDPDTHYFTHESNLDPLTTMNVDDSAPL